ncbi:hypothetical protein E1301_Tti020263 [Triplophysa tibetana]|uniref:Uncharacterized protein n=1 Tax=Triplophysa tibetana TaxID=1572043 RepID=A0A5A9NLS0_9TELE|nr:hypothetical protein E1301_Tti020263 [Triplophysa tibetana]
MIGQLLRELNASKPLSPQQDDQMTAHAEGPSPGERALMLTAQANLRHEDLAAVGSVRDGEGRGKPLLSVLSAVQERSCPTGLSTAVLTPALSD